MGFLLGRMVTNFDRPKQIFRLIFFAILFFFVANSSWAIAASAKLSLPGPNGVKFTFCPIKLKGGSGPLAGQTFTMGDPSGEFRTPPTRVVVGAPFKDGDERFYYLGECEVTEGQYLAVMGQTNASRPKSPSLEHPAVNLSYFEVQAFIDRLNQWLYANALAQLPKSGETPAFLRLPTEAEWEFAARGGNAVSATVFDAETPYGDEDLNVFEWFSGPDSSHNKIQKAGKLKPNPLGLHDMLGNVQEMTSSIYQVEYYQGRNGGFVARGGHYLTNEDEMISAKRSEEPLYLGTVKEGMRPNSKPTLGFRLILSVPILTDRKAIADLGVAWKTHRSGAGGNLPAALSVASIDKQEAVPANEALVRLNRIRAELAKVGLEQSLKKEIAATEAALQNMVEVRRKADQDSAEVFAKMAGERGKFLQTNLDHLALVQATLRKLELQAVTPSDNLKRREEQITYNIDLGFENYGVLLKELAKLPKDLVQAGFQEEQKRLDKLISTEQKSSGPNVAERVKDLTLQKKCLKITAAHYERYDQDKRFDSGKWRQDYATLR